MIANKGVLLVNLGSPDSPAVGDVRRFLREFLMDGKVLDVSYLARFFLVHFLSCPSARKPRLKRTGKYGCRKAARLSLSAKKCVRNFKPGWTFRLNWRCATKTRGSRKASTTCSNTP